jgi:hypothetical protein
MMVEMNLCQCPGAVKPERGDLVCRCTRCGGARAGNVLAQSDRRPADVAAIDVRPSERA